MMACKAGEEHLHHISDPWRVSSLVRAFFELILALCLVLCAIISVTTTRLIKSSGLFDQTWASCDIREHHQSRQGSDLEGYDKLADSCDLSRNRGSCVGRCRGDPPIPMKMICEVCTHFLSDCACTLKHGSSVVDDDNSPVRFRYPCVTGYKSINNNNIDDYCDSDHPILSTVDNDTDSYGRIQRSFENVESSCDDGSSERIVIDRKTIPAAYGCVCRSCMGIPTGGGCSSLSKRSPSKALQRNFVKVFPNDNSNMSRGGGASCSSRCCGHHSANGFVDTKSFIISEGGPAEIRESEGDSNDDGPQLGYNDSLSSRSLSDGSAAQDPMRVGRKDSAKDLSQESFSYKTSNRSRASPGGSSFRCADVSRNRFKLSIDTDSLAGESSTPEWCGSSDSPSPYPAAGNEMEIDMEGDVMESGSTVQLEQDPEIGVMELTEAFHEEQEALAALYLELEEERNAASSAAYETMAMITRLQEEKAAIQMEARQYQRMAEEKHQYDQESMDMMQEILVKRDEEVYALEEEVNKYRQRLLTLGMEELMDRSSGDRETVGSPKRSEVLLIERETLLVEGSEDWKNRRDRRDEKILAEIKDWLHEASERALVAPERIEEPNVHRRSLPKIAGTINRLLPGNGKKNLFESFSSVGMEDIQRDGVTEEFEAHSVRVTNEEDEAHREETTNEEVGTSNRDSAAGYESFQGMMESLRQEPSLKDEESLETLKKIEEKFRRQSSAGKVRRSGDELRQIWKSILRSFESDERQGCEAHEVEGGADLRRSPTTAVEPANTSDSPQSHEEVTDTDRSIGEKRISVLEYVSKFEEQLHQLGNKKPPLQPTKAGLSTLVESVAEDPPESSIASSELMDSDKSKNLTFGGDRPVIPIKTRLRKRRTADSRNATPDAERYGFAVRGEGFPSCESATRNPDVRFDNSPDFEESNQYGSSLVHDVYEVQRDPRETISSHFRKDKVFRQDVKKYVSSTRNELVPGQFIDSHEIARCVELYSFDNGTPDFVAGHTLLEHEANGKGRLDWDCSTARVRNSVKEPGMCTQAAAIWPGECMNTSRESDGCALQSPSSVVTDSPRTRTQDIVQQLTKRLKVLETDRQILQDTVASLERENGDMKVLQDIAQQLRRGIEKTAVANTNTWLADDAGFISSIKGLLSWDKLRHSVQSQLSKLVQLCLANGDPGGSQRDQQVGLFRLLHNSHLSKQQRPFDRTKSLKAVCAANSGHSDDQVQPFIATLSPPVSQHGWPRNAKERSDTAFSGWDY